MLRPAWSIGTYKPSTLLMARNTMSASMPEGAGDEFYELILCSLELIASLGDTIYEAALFQMELVEAMGLTGPAGRRVTLGEL